MNTLARYHAANLPELMEKIHKNGIGLDDYLNRFWESDVTSNYPPYNLIQLNNHESKLEIALAGFKEDELKVYTEFGKLYIEGKKEESEVDGTFIHKGLAQRSFERVWQITDDTEIGYWSRSIILERKGRRRKPNKNVGDSTSPFLVFHG